MFNITFLLPSISFLKLRQQFWSNKGESWEQALASVMRLANLVIITSKAKGERTLKTEFVWGKEGWSGHGGDAQVK